MFDFIVLLKDLWVDIIGAFNDRPLLIAGYEVSYFSLLFAFIVIGFAVSYFWKGAKT